MKKFETLYLVTIQALGYMWYLSVFAILLPAALVALSEGSDFFIFDGILNIAQPVLPSILNPIVTLVALVVLTMGLMIILEASFSLYHKANAFPFTIIPHKHLEPDELVTVGWYGKVRHPMKLGYIIMLLALGIYTQSITFLILWLPLVTGLMLEYGLIIEERGLQRQFGNSYKKYKKKVPVLLPKF